MVNDIISICLPKGNPMEPLAGYFEKIKFPVREYHSQNRGYRPAVENLPVRAKIMAEKDVPIQVSIGNYDIGFSGLDWIRELTTKYRGSDIHVFKHLKLDSKCLYACTGINGDFESVSDLHKKNDFITIVSEYPNLAEHFAVQNRLRKFKVFSAWGSVEAYPPEHADVVILSAYDPESLLSMGLFKISCELESDLTLIVNRKSFILKSLSRVLAFFSDSANVSGES
ncbi:MAG: ATP phosphoribosyltransferase [Desulfobacterales bacterium]